MTLRWDVLLAILGMALVTYACRAGGYAALRAVRPPPFVERLLQHLPGALFVAYVTPGLAAQGPAAWLGVAATVAAQLLTGNLGAAVVAGVAALWLVRVAGL